MSDDRRTFLKRTAAVGGALALTGASASPLRAALSDETPAAKRSPGRAAGP